MNAVNILGRLTRDPEKHYGKEIFATFTLAFSEGEQTVFVPVLAFSRLAEIVLTYLKKGSQVAISGRLYTHATFIERQRRTALKVIADKIDFLNTTPGTANAQAEEQALEEELPF